MSKVFVFKLTCLQNVLDSDQQSDKVINWFIGDQDSDKVINWFIGDHDSGLNEISMTIVIMSLWTQIELWDSLIGNNQHYCNMAEMALLEKLVVQVFI